MAVFCGVVLHLVFLQRVVTIFQMSFVMFLVMMNLLSNFIFFILIVVIVISIFARWRERTKFINLPMESLLFQPFYCNSWSVLCYEVAVLTVLFRWFIALVSPSKDEILIFLTSPRNNLLLAGVTDDS